MNFKPTTLKVIISVLVGVLVSFAFTQIIPQSPSPTAYSIDWLKGILSVVVIYVVWSLIQKKK